MEAVSWLKVSSQNWDFAFGYLVSGRFTVIYNLVVLVLLFVLGLRVLQMSSRCKEINRFFDEFRGKSVDLGNGFCSRSDFGGVCCSKIMSCGELVGVERGEWGYRQKEDNIFMDWRNENGCRTVKARKLVDLGNGFCSGNDVVGVCCSKILSCCSWVWRLIKSLIILPGDNLKGDGEIVVGRSDSGCQPKEEGSMDCGYGNNSSTFKIRGEEEEEEDEGFQECEEEDFVGFDAAYLQCRNKNYKGTFMMRKFMAEDSDDDEENEGEDFKEYEGDDLIGLKKAFRIERECRNAAILELEKERIAAASAANEAMAMIQRLQNEKSLIEMEARQFRYIAEQKQLYDQEVIQSLQWIISKHELERSILESELKQCRKRLLQRGWFDEIVGDTKEHQEDEMISDSELGDQLK